MALRAGYYGVKRRIWEAIQSTSAKLVQDVKDIWSNNDITGVHNIFSVPAGYSVKSGSSVSFADSVYTIITDTTNDAGMYFSAAATLRPAYAGFSGVKAILSFEYKADAIFNGVVGFDTAVKYSTDFVKYEAKITDLSQISAIVFYDRDTTSGHTITVKNLMIRLDTDPDTAYTAYAMTNQELTKAVYFKGVLLTGVDLNDIKEAGIYTFTSTPTSAPTGVDNAVLIVTPITTGNVNQTIIKTASAKSEIYSREYGGSPASWFNWYKYTGTAVTQSKAPADDPELSVEEPEVVKKSTRKTTTKKTEKEG